MNQDGRSSSLTAPNGPAQQEVLRAALADGGLTPLDLSGLQMHGTGTALGDPIEVGAALQVFYAAGSPGSKLARRTDAHTPQQAMYLLAAKATVGHAEPAAGLTGLIYAAQQAASAAALPVQHLRSINPHVASAVDSTLQGAAAVNGCLSMPRTAMPLQSLAGAELRGLTALGVSAFAFQGSNAHAIVTSTAHGSSLAALNRSSRSAAGWDSPSVPWSTSRVWVHPAPCTLLTTVVKAAAGRGVVYELELSAAQMTHVWDHRVSGAALVPGVLFMEMAACALQQAMLASSSSGSKAAPALADVTIPAALVLPDLEAGQSDRQAARLRCLVQQDMVQVSSSSRSAGGMQHTLHLQAQPAAIAICSSDNTAPHTGQRLRAALASLLPGICSAVQPAASASAGTLAAATAMLSACEHQGHSAASGCAEPSQLDALLQLAAVQRGHLRPDLAEQLQVPAAAELYFSATASAKSHSSSTKLASAAVRPGLTANTMVADFQLVAADGAGSVCSIVGLQAKKATAAALVRRPVPLPQASPVGGRAVAETEVSDVAGG